MDCNKNLVGFRVMLDRAARGRNALVDRKVEKAYRAIEHKPYVG